MTRHRVPDLMLTKEGNEVLVTLNSERAGRFESDSRLKKDGTTAGEADSNPSIACEDYSRLHASALHEYP